MSEIFNANRTPDFNSGEIIVIDKEKGWSSFDIVNKIKFILKHKFGLNKIKIGHAGTLDPLATGVMIICTGKATKTISELQITEKEYLATIQIGATTPSYDLETEITQTFPTDSITEKQILQVLKCFEGEIYQTPPIFSAIWHKGKRAYKFAREGQEINLKKRKVFINNIKLEEFILPYATLSVTCSTGTYIRSLANDIGKKLDNGAFLYYLRRIRCGNFTLNDAINIEEFEKIINKM